MGILAALAITAESCASGTKVRDPVVDDRDTAGSGLSIAATGREVVVAYGGPFAEGGVYLARSHDAGATFAENDRVLVDAEGQGTTSIVISGGMVAVAYGTKTGIRVARSEDGGGHFSSVDVDADPYSYRPSLVTTGGNLFLTFAESAIPGMGIPGGIAFTRSMDGGATWSPPSWVSRVEAGMPSLAITGNTLYSVAFDVSQKALQVAHSADDGETWTIEPEQRDLEPTGALVALPDALLLPSVDQDGHPFVSESRDGGATWTSRLISVENAFGETTFYSFNHSLWFGGPHIASTGGTTYAIFNLFPPGNALGFARSEDRGVTWPPEHAVEAFVSPGSGTLAEWAGIAFAKDEEGDAIVVTFFDQTEKYNLKAVRSLDGGATWH